MWIAELLFPSRCIACGAPADLLCGACVRSLRVLGEPSCRCCGAPTAWPVARCRECAGRRIAFASARAALAYTGPARPLVHAWKERGRRSVVRLAGQLVSAHVLRPDAVALVPVPASADRLLRRGHQSARALACELGSLWELPVRDALRRRGSARRQVGLTADDRRRNVRGAFEARHVPDGPVALVDDVYTTGATANACANALRRAGATRVEVVTLARAVLDPLRYSPGPTRASGAARRSSA